MPTRALTPLEIPYVVTNTTSSGSFVVRGPVDADRLAAAYAALRREHPVLTGRIVPTAFGFDVAVPDAPVAEDVAPVTVERRAFAPGDVRLGLRPEAGTAALQLVSDGLLHRVTLGVNHAIADGAHALYLNLRLWQLYTDPAAEAAPAPGLPLAPLDLAGRVRDSGAAAPAHPAVAVESAGSVPTAVAVDGGEFGFERIRIDAPATDGLRLRAKAAGLSMHGLLAGLIVAAERAELPGPVDRAASMAVFSPVDLRGRCDPPVAPAAVTNFAGSSTAPITVRGDAAPEAIGRAVLDRLRADLADGTVAAALTGAAGDPVTGGAPVRLSDIGAIPAPATPDGVVALDFHTSSEVDIERVRPLVRSGPPEALAPLVGLHYHALTFDGRLSIELRHAPGTLSAEAVRRIRGRIERALTAPVGAAA
ncbi:acyltransferase [Tsukamurella sp. 1534]|uniref:phthiocerol/phthiodiolone dimycocerosyl transferase family protein n=1 Tax=Tsukamurella sp. 1534 TaxID=1151061 RepID=UPI000318C76F|nr:acyltransferase [Tsukamurella sp. 1534]